MFCSCIFGPFGVAFASLGKGVGLVLVLFVHLLGLRLFGLCLFPLPLRVCDGLRLMIMALPGLFSYLFYTP